MITAIRILLPIIFSNQSLRFVSILNLAIIKTLTNDPVSLVYYPEHLSHHRLFSHLHFEIYLHQPL
jgi:hypothetical protein